MNWICTAVNLIMPEGKKVNVAFEPVQGSGVIANANILQVDRASCPYQVGEVYSASFTLVKKA